MARIARDPRGWLSAQLDDSSLPKPLADLPTAQASMTTTLRRLAEGAERYMNFLRQEAAQMLRRDAARRTAAAILSPVPFRERLVHFWSNHFTVSSKRFQIIAAAGAFEREVIRPRVTGSFTDLLLGSTKHPVMLAYLDNQQSFGPNSMAGQRRGVGLNENLAREILELHTLGVGGGYDQQDVIGLAKMITGWGIAQPAEGSPGGFVFRPQGHEPGAHAMLGKTYAAAGVAQGEAALRDLARHPATAVFVARKMARHFIADQPDDATIAKLARTFRDTEGDLRQMALALIATPELWDEPLSKFKTPNDLVISTFRALGGIDPGDDALIGALAIFDQFPFSAPSPAGWSDQAGDWLSPEALMRRIEWGQAVAQRIPVNNPRALAEDLLGPMLGRETRETIAQAQSPAEGLALLFASPEFQRK
ncbi:MAG: DUF1800 domain-containing protein [Alphaproteobacteria bacterium]|nr:DUF1800 domain-containing protein [Alphaproteobacteria bacterium]